MNAVEKISDTKCRIGVLVEGEWIGSERGRFSGGGFTTRLFWLLRNRAGGIYAVESFVSSVGTTFSCWHCFRKFFYQ